MAYGRFNPLDDTNTYPFMNGRNPGVYGNSYKTFAQLLEDINAKGFNTAIVRPSKSGDGNLAYYTIISFNIPDSDTFHIGNDEYFTGSYYPNGIYFENFGDVSVPNVGGYYYANGSLVDTGVSYTLYTRCSATQSKDNVSYHGVSGEDNNCLDLGCVIVSNANVGIWYFNNSPLISAITSNGGGATHIAKRAGLLSSIGASNLSDILMVSGGGGGGLIIGEDVYAGKDAGGISGSGNNSANQTTGYAFGQGESDEGVSGGGGGLYGGYKGGTS